MTNVENGAQEASDPREIAEVSNDLPRTAKFLPVGASVRVARLSNAVELRAELARVYREARAREGRYPSAQTALRLANVLSALRAAIETEDLAKRIERLEISEENKR